MVALALSPIFSLTEACGGEVLGGPGSGTCASVCSSLSACEPGTATLECQEGCQMEQSLCTSPEASATFQSLLDCLAGIACTGGSGEAYLLTIESSCGSQVQQAEEACGGGGVVLPQEAGCCQVPPFDSGTDVQEMDAPSFDEGTDSPFADGTPFDVVPSESGSDAPTDSADAADAGHDD